MTYDANAYYNRINSFPNHQKYNIHASVPLVEYSGDVSLREAGRVCIGAALVNCRADKIQFIFCLFLPKVEVKKGGPGMAGSIVCIADPSSPSPRL